MVCRHLSSAVNIIGINAYHGDSAAALVIDGRIVAAAEEERFRRMKHWAGFPSQAISYCLEEAGLKLGDLDAIALNSDPTANLMKKVGFTLKNRPELGLVLDRIRNRKERHSVVDELGQAFPGEVFRGDVINVEHHLAHLASAFYCSGFKQATAVSVDGFGDFASAAWGVGRGASIEVAHRVYFPHSLGIFYQALTQFLGFPHYGDEYKVMGLAPYGKPRFFDEMRRIVDLQEDGGYALNLDYFRHHSEKVDYEWSDGAPAFGRLFSDRLSELLGPIRAADEPLTQHHFDIAHSIQAMYEEAFFALLAKRYEQDGEHCLVLAGGCGMNSVANGKVYRRSPFKRLYIQSAAGDAGGAIGAALIATRELGGDPTPGRMAHAYLGPQFGGTEMGECLDQAQERLEQAGCTVALVEEEDPLCRQVAGAIADGQVVGWFQGRMEWGPRALGNRSILCDPRRADMKEILNAKIKRRESFRPFAPSILRDQVSQWFEEDDEVPFMMKVFQIRKERREQIPAVTHVDGSGRLQTVDEHSNSLYHRLISHFAELTDVPIVLNTSFNENEPVVCRPQEALDCFLRTKMDLLVLGNWVVQRR